MTQRLQNEIEHGKYLIENDAGKVWNWESPAGKLRWQRRVKMLSSNLKKGDTVLELGCGTGYFTQELIKTEATVTAIDISPELLEKAKTQIKSDNINFVIGNACKMPFEDSSFDYVIGSSVLHHLDLIPAINEIYRVLKQNGRIHFTEPNMLNPQIALQKNIPYLKKILGDSPDETAFFRWSTYKILKETGFSTINIVPFDFLHPKTPKLFIKAINKYGHFYERIPFLREVAGSLFITAVK